MFNSQSGNKIALTKHKKSYDDLYQERINKIEAAHQNQAADQNVEVCIEPQTVTIKGGLNN